MHEDSEHDETRSITHSRAPVCVARASEVKCLMIVAFKIAMNFMICYVKANSYRNPHITEQASTSCINSVSTKRHNNYGCDRQASLKEQALFCQTEMIKLLFLSLLLCVFCLSMLGTILLIVDTYLIPLLMQISNFGQTFILLPLLVSKQNTGLKHSMKYYPGAQDHVPIKQITRESTVESK